MSELVIGLLDKDFRCECCGNIFNPPIDAATITEAIYCQDCQPVASIDPKTGE